MGELAWQRRVAQVARALQAETGSIDTIELSVKLAVETINGAEDASLSLAHRGQIVETAAATSERALSADRLQQQLGSGPLLADVWDQEVVSCPDLQIDERWGKWGARLATDMGIESMLCFRMFADRERLGAISLYASDPHAFKAVDIEDGVSFAAHTAIAVEVARTDDNLELALDSRSVIGQATGIAMERYGIDAVRAFALLKRLSQDTNTKLHEVATEVIRTRDLP